MKPYILRPLEAPAVRALWTAQLFSEIGDWAARVAITLLVFRRTDSAGVSALVTAAALLPWVGIGQWLAAVGDRHSRRRVMVVSDLARASIYLALLIPMPVPAILALVFVSGCGSPPFDAARSALLPKLSGEALYPASIALTSATYQAAIIVGAVLGGGAVEAVGVRPAIALNSGSFIVSALLLRGLPDQAPIGSDKPSRGVAAGWHAVVSDRLVRRAIILYSSVAASAIAIEALGPAFASEASNSSGSFAGIAIALIAAGDLTATALIPVRGGDAALLRLTGLIAMSGCAVSAAAFALTPSRLSVVVGFVGAGVIFASAIPANTMIGTRLPDESRSAAFGILSGILRASNAVAALLAGALASIWSPRWVFVLGTVAALLAAAWSFLFPATPTTQRSD